MPPVLIATVSYLQCCVATLTCQHTPLTTPTHPTPLIHSLTRENKNIIHKNFIFRDVIHCPGGVLIVLESQFTTGLPSLSQKQQNKQ